MAGYEESIDIEEIRELALRYIDESECGAVIRPKDVFALLVRPAPTIFTKKKIVKWRFAGYCLLMDYTINPDEKPYGKWITMKYMSLSTFPPVSGEIRLQPPHIAKGYFQGFDRKSETKIVPAILSQAFPNDNYNDNNDDNDEEQEAEILQFPNTTKE